MRILAPTDFSRASHNILLNTVRLAKIYGAELVFMHAMQRPIVPAISPEEVYNNIYNAEREEINQKLRAEVRAVFQELQLRPTELHHQIAILSTPVSDAILESISKYRIDLVIMGAFETNTIKRLFLGSNTLEMIKLTPIPLLIFPDNYEFKDFNTISIIFERDEADDRNGFRILERFAHTFKATLHLIIINDDESELDEIKNFLSSAQELDFIKQYSSLQKVLPSDDSKVLQYLQESNSNLIVCLPGHNSLWKDSITGSITTESIDNLNIPLLVVPILQFRQ